ncbi:cellulose biosynthesis protein BcsQ [Paraburkholderia susongensis]|uniref:Cellulose synthase operon protein YhjQ n=1 Tax=Paraburkholderia susongensis TaxID=1515439 RepID=A0A1X7LRU6_9BURK|nr:cellulose biosynthesis protein BcsQ [Paraburkholderia susongensis]SMG56380.1 cellulose synthase operon protein YhjQ [Paraburkholderia susongensis]
MKTIAIVSPVGGAGRTTLTAELASLLSARGHRMLAVECDPRNVLALHFGLKEPARAGLTSYLESANPANTALNTDDNVLLLPWGGGDTARGAPAGARAQLLASPGWLRELLARVDMPPDALALIDTPTWPSVETSQAIASADLVLAVLPPSPTACAVLMRFREALAGTPCVYVINAVIPARELHVDVVALLRTSLGDALLPYQIHADAGLPEALGRGENFCASASGSAAAHDLQGLAAWLSRWASRAGEPLR